MTVRTLTDSDHTPARNACFTDPAATQKDISLRAAHILNDHLTRHVVPPHDIGMAVGVA